MTILKTSLFRCTLGAMLLLSASAVFAEALVKQLPTPDTSKLSADVAKSLVAARADFDKAQVDLIGDDLAAAYALMGAEYARANLNDAAAIAFYDASQLAPKDGRWLYLRGVIANAQKLPADARANFQAALALDQVYLPIRFRLADTLANMGDTDGAHKLLLEALPKYPDMPVLLAMLGRVELAQKQYGQAIDHLNQALKLEPQANALYKDLAAAYTGQGNAQLAADAKAKAGAMPPDMADPLVAGMYRSGSQQAASQQSASQPAEGTPLQQARRLLAQHNIPLARAAIEVALKSNGNDVEALQFAAQLDAMLSKRDLAQDEAAHALKLKPDSADANLAQGMVYEIAGDEANASVFYQRAAHADPKLADAQLLLGNAQMRSAHYAEAAEHYRQLAAIAPDNIEATGRLVAAQVAAGRCGDALAHVNNLLVKRAQDGNLMQIFVRLASTCAAAKTDERNMALDYARALYKQRPDASDSAALALAYAAQGKFDEAQQSQAQAIYEAVRAGNTPLAQMYRSTMRQFAAKQAPDRPWPAEHPYFKPERLAPTPVAAPSAAK
jgi:tetratricopeptide (TPR) repeat protein